MSSSPRELDASASATYGESVGWRPERPRWTPGRFLISWLVVALSVLVAGLVVPGFSIDSLLGALAVALVISLLNALVPPVIASARLPLPIVSGFLLMLFANAYLLLLAEEISQGAQEVRSFWAAFAASFVMSATMVVLEVIFGTNDDATFDAKVIRRVAHRQGGVETTDVPGLIILEIDGLSHSVLQRAMRDGHAPVMASWLADKSHRLAEWETDLSSQTGASQAGILLGANGNIPAFRWVEKETGRMVACSAPADCAEIERERATGRGLLTNGGASRGNLLSGEADEVILTVSRMAAEFRANPGYRAFFSVGHNVTRTLVLFFWEVVLEWSAAIRARRRNVRPRGHRGGLYPFMRAAMCVVLRDLIVFGVLADMMRGKPAVYATFSSYDEVAHHSGLERADTLEALRKVDQAFGRIAQARRFAPRPYEIIVLSDHGQTQGATFKQRNGYSLEELVHRSLETGPSVVGGGSGDETNSMVGRAIDEATGRSARKAAREREREQKLPTDSVAVLGSGNLGLIYLLEENRRLTKEEIDERHPRLLQTLRAHPHIGWLLVRSATDGPLALGPSGVHYLADGRVEGDDPLALFSASAPKHLLRTDGYKNVADITVGSFYDPMLDEGCAFEELISFHGGLGGPQTRPFLLHPAELPLPPKQIIGAEAVHGLLRSWRATLQGDSAVALPPSDADLAALEAESPPARRPRSITVIAILAVLQALAVLALGVGLIAVGDDPSVLAEFDGSSSLRIASGTVLIVLSFALLLVAGFLWRGAVWARLVIAGIELINIGTGVQQTLNQPGTAFWSALWQIGVGLLVLALLYSSRSDAFFRRARPG